MDFRDIVKIAKSERWKVDYTSKGHVKFTSLQGGPPVFGSGTPSDSRSMKNLAAELRRRGLNLPHRGGLKRVVEINSGGVSDVLLER